LNHFPISVVRTVLKYLMISPSLFQTTTNTQQKLLILMPLCRPDQTSVDVTLNNDHMDKLKLELNLFRLIMTC
jgi:hypothetical protein